MGDAGRAHHRPALVAEIEVLALFHAPLIEWNREARLVDIVPDQHPILPDVLRIGLQQGDVDYIVVSAHGRHRLLQLMGVFRCLWAKLGG